MQNLKKDACPPEPITKAVFVLVGIAPSKTTLAAFLPKFSNAFVAIVVIFTPRTKFVTFPQLRKVFWGMDVTPGPSKMSGPNGWL